MTHQKNLILQKASAGSGKTYALARRYITYLLTDTDEQGIRHLRPERQIAEASRSILAVTFTQKATKEMKQRIVARLAELADPALPDSRKEYLKYFTDELKIAPDALLRSARTALASLLNNYSDFQVSTIDSFFQTVLRTFAYEVDLNTAYEVEIDPDYVQKQAVGITFDDLDSERADSRVKRWLKHLNSGAASGMDVFGSDSGSLYGILLQAVGRMTHEDFKEVRDDLARWFGSHPGFIETFLQTRADMERRLGRHVAGAVEAARAFLDSVPEGETYLHSIKLKTLRKICQMRAPWRSDDAQTVASQKWADDSDAADYFLKVGYFKRYRGTAEHESVALAGAAFRDAVVALRTFVTSAYGLWKAYSQNMPYLWLMNVIGGRINEIVSAGNLMLLGETNYILQRIIADDEVPFIYERLGSRIDHYLIDEFQDTSRMQWLNFRPLLADSLSRQRENLIIGDAKQSIYRFRNADPSIITARVPGDFGHHIPPADPTERSTNFRSCRNIVEFNNAFFAAFARYLDANDAADGHYARLYAEVEQNPRHKEQKGYVEMRLAPAGATDPDTPDQYDLIARRIGEMTATRRWRKRDIAILVDKHDTGHKMVDAIERYNASLADADSRITMVSEESLQIASSPAVMTILSVLRMIAEGRDSLREYETKNEKYFTYGSKSYIFQCCYRLFAMAHPELNANEAINTFLATPKEDLADPAEIMALESLALPQLVERIIFDYIQPPRDTDGIEPERLSLLEEQFRMAAPYLASFQDAVLDYCDKDSTDLYSFLQWWEMQKDRLSIMPAEGSDDVAIMTIHKSKGLEFPVVFIPHVSEDFGLTLRKKTEWLWVKPDMEALGYAADDFPPYVPVDTDDALDGIPLLRPAFRKHVIERHTDFVNSVYVAFTRAGAELYVYLGRSSKIARDILPTIDGNTADIAADPDLVYTSGAPLDDEDILRMQHTDETPADIRPLDKYTVRPADEFIIFRADDTDAARQRGIRLHEIMSRINTIDDVPRAVAHAQAHGRISAAEADEFRALITKYLSHPMVKSWFAPGLRVFTERTAMGIPMPKGGGPVGNTRPDRITIDAEGNITIIDYKFGRAKRDAKYIRQMRTYMYALGQVYPERALQIKGYIWYVTLGEVAEA